MSESVPSTRTESAPADAAAEESAAKTELSVALELDCSGMSCPLPILKTKKAIDGLAAGDILKMIATDPGSVPDVAAFSRRTGHEVVQQSEGEGEYAFWIRKT